MRRGDTDRVIHVSLGESMQTVTCAPVNRVPVDGRMHSEESRVRPCASEREGRREKVLVNCFPSEGSRGSRGGGAVSPKQPVATATAAALALVLLPHLSSLTLLCCFILLAVSEVTVQAQLTEAQHARSLAVKRLARWRDHQRLFVPQQ